MDDGLRPSEYELAMASIGPRMNDHAMKKRALAALLWFYAMWYAGAMIAHVLGVSPVLGPILGAAAAAIVAVDPRGIIWDRRSSASRDTSRKATSAQFANLA